MTNFAELNEECNSRGYLQEENRKTTGFMTIEYDYKGKLCCSTASQFVA